MLAPIEPDVIAPLNFRQGDETWTKYRERAQTDLYFFASVVLGYGELVPMTIGAHGLLCKFVERQTGVPALDTAKYRKINLARGWGRSTIVTRAYAMQRLLRNPNTALLLANEREQTAADFLAEIKSHFETNTFLRALFPDIIPENVKQTIWTASRIAIARTHPRPEPSIAVIGVGGTVTGSHPDCIIVDDAISRAAMENARSGSWDIMHQVNRWIHQLVPLLNPNAKPFPEILFIGTPWFHSDCYSHIDDHFGYGERPVKYALRLRLPDGQVQQVICFRVGDLAVFRRPAIEDGRSAFPEKWSLEDLAKIQLGDPLLFSANYLLNPSDSASAVFKLDWLREFEWIDDQRMVKYLDAAGATKRRRVADLDTVVCFDPGGFSGRSVDQRARAAICVTGSTGAGEHLLLETYSEPDTLLAGIRKLATLVTRYSPRKLVLLADDDDSVLATVRATLAEQGATVPIELVPPTTRQQEQHILQLEPWFQRGHLYVGKGAAFQEFRTQYSQFPRAARFDLLKALAYAPAVWKKQPGGAQFTTEERRAHELAQYRARRGLTA